LPAPTVNGRRDRPGNMQFLELQKPRDLDLDLGSGHMAYHHASVIDLYVRTSFVDGRMDVPTDKHFRRPPLTLLGRLGGIDLKTGVCTRFNCDNNM